MSDTFGGVRPRGQLDADELREAGEALDRAKLAYSSRGDFTFSEGHGGRHVHYDPADLFFAKITAVVTSTKYGFIEQVLNSDGAFEDAGEPRNCDGVLNWAYPQEGDSYTVDDVVCLRRSSYNPDLFEIVVIPGGRVVTKGKLDGTLSFGGNAVMSVWELVGGVETDTGENLTVYDWLLSSGQTIVSGKQVTARKIAGRWYVDGSQCV